MTWYHILLVALGLIGSWFLYDRGYLIVKSKRAVTFIGSRVKNGFAFQFTGCTGYVGRVLRVKEKGTYTVSLDAKLTKGEVRFLLLDSAKTPLLILTPDYHQGGVYLEPGKRYHIRMEFDHASGDSEARWGKE